MPKWTEQSSEYVAHIDRVSKNILRDVHEKRLIPTDDLIKKWHRELFRPVAHDARTAGNYRRADIAHLAIEVHIGGVPGAPCRMVLAKMTDFGAKIRSKTAKVDAEIELASYEDRFRMTVDVAAWAHGELIRIHPFVDGNGRTARLVANCLLGRYSIPYSLPLKPRPRAEYELASAISMGNDDSAMCDYLTYEIVQYAATYVP